MVSESKRGSRIATLVFLLIVCLVMYAAVKIVPPYRAYYSMEDEAAQQMTLIQVNPINPEAIVKSDLFSKAQELELPLEKDDIEVTRGPDGVVSVRMEWGERVDFGYGITRDFYFKVDVDNRNKLVQGQAP